MQMALPVLKPSPLDFRLSPFIQLQHFSLMSPFLPHLGVSKQPCHPYSALLSPHQFLLKADFLLSRLSIWGPLQEVRLLAWLEGVLESPEGFGFCLFEYAMLQHGLVCFAASLLAGSG